MSFVQWWCIGQIVLAAVFFVELMWFAFFYPSTSPYTSRDRQ